MEKAALNSEIGGELKGDNVRGRPKGKVEKTKALITFSNESIKRLETITRVVKERWNEKLTNGEAVETGLYLLNQMIEDSKNDGEIANELLKAVIKIKLGR